MNGATLYPINFSNRRGLPLIEVNTTTVGTDSVVLNIPNGAFRFLQDKGIFLLYLTTAIPTGTTATLPIVLSSNNVTQALTNIGGAAITVAQLPGAGVYEVFFDKSRNILQLLTAQIPT